jgi:hypothetical protein
MLELLGDIVGDPLAEILIEALCGGLSRPFQRPMSKAKSILGFNLISGKRIRDDIGRERFMQ